MHTQVDNSGADFYCFCPFILVITLPYSFGKPPLCPFQTFQLVELANGRPQLQLQGLAHDLGLVTERFCLPGHSDWLKNREN